MKLLALVAVPPAVVMAIFPVIAPVGTVAVTCVSESTVKLAATSSNVTPVVCVRLTPVIWTSVPTRICKTANGPGNHAVNYRLVVVGVGPPRTRAIPGHSRRIVRPSDSAGNDATGNS